MEGGVKKEEEAGEFIRISYWIPTWKAQLLDTENAVCSLGFTSFESFW